MGMRWEGAAAALPALSWWPPGFFQLLGEASTPAAAPCPAWSREWVGCARCRPTCSRHPKEKTRSLNRPPLWPSCPSSSLPKEARCRSKGAAYLLGSVLDGGDADGIYQGLGALG